jgi:hypothetical protein
MDDPVSPKQPADAPPAPAELRTRGRLTRKQVADRLGVSVSKVRTMEGKSLNPIKIEGVNYFERSEVDAAALSMGRKGAAHMTEGEVAAAVFELIDHGKELREIVIELEQPPSIVRALYREWLDDFDAGEQRLRQSELEAKREREERAAHKRDEADMRAYEHSMAAILKQSR